MTLKENKELKLNTINNIDCLEGYKLLEDNSIDLIIADPPYNLSKSSTHWKWNNEVKNIGFGGKWNITNEDWDDISFDDYWKFSTSWILESKRVLKPTGSIWVFGTYHNIGIFNVSIFLSNLGDFLSFTELGPPDNITPDKFLLFKIAESILL